MKRTQRKEWKRLIDGQQCGCRECAVEISPEEHGLRFAVSPNQAKKLSWLINVGKEGGRIVLHQTCFERMQGQVKKKRGGYTALLNSLAEEAEYFDSLQDVKDKVASVAEALLRPGAKTCVLTGAGMSASANIKTYRGMGGIDVQKQEEVIIDPDCEENLLGFTLKRPTLGHRVLGTLVAHGLVNFVATQNNDGLHVRTGIPLSDGSLGDLKQGEGGLTILHGCLFAGVCDRCQRVTWGDMELSAWSEAYAEEWAKWGRLHHRGERKRLKKGICRYQHFCGPDFVCSACGENVEGYPFGTMKDTIIHFGDVLHKETLGGLERAQREFTSADVILVLGTSGLVVPAASLIQLNKQAKVVVCNLQEVEVSKRFTYVAGSTDMFLDLLAQALEITPLTPIPKEPRDLPFLEQWKLGYKAFQKERASQHRKKIKKY